MSSPLTSRVERCEMMTSEGRVILLARMEKHGENSGVNEMTGPTSTATPRNVRWTGGATDAPNLNTRQSRRR